MSTTPRCSIFRYSRGDAVRRSAKILHVANLTPGRKRVVVFGLNQEAIPDGPLLTISTAVSSSANEGDYLLETAASAGVDPAGKLAALSIAPGKISVRNAASEAILLNGVRNGASLVPGPVAPGELLTLLGSGIGPVSPTVPSTGAAATELAGTSVWFDENPAYLLYASRNQLNLVVPFGIAGQALTRLQIRQNDASKTAIEVPVVTAVPGIFTLNSSGIGSAAVLNQDFTLNAPGNPADRGSIISVFATGAGQTEPAGVDGQIARTPLPKPLVDVSVRIGGVNAEIVYAGAAPGLISGMLQINCRVPASAEPAWATPLELQVGNAVSPPGVTIAIR